MIYWFLIAQALLTVAVWVFFHYRDYRWTFRHTLFCTLIPLFLFVVWTALWWFGVLPVDRLPGSWFDGAGSIGERAFLCLPPLGASWLLFIIFGVKRYDHAAS